MTTERQNFSVPESREMARTACGIPLSCNSRTLWDSKNMILYFDEGSTVFLFALSLNQDHQHDSLKLKLVFLLNATTFHFDVISLQPQQEHCSDFTMDFR
ncbi:hypothetical protein AVEN_218739-1 [Araneus ventricosus]|uniref:Uncharacterized protein n=1 Tax=Araneus ventricosus TaxID=182803 RepID=A0A4Y2B7J3_ARAVE|nr:hypothetical protein AVEN_218739-1 [Araneus ventricosus]